MGYAKYANGTTYQGTFIDAMHDGNGIMKSPDGYIYDGTWENGVKQGTATVTYPY